MRDKQSDKTTEAIVDAMGALVICLTRQMTTEQREAFADDLARLARNAESRGNTMLETLLIDLHRAAR